MPTCFSQSAYAHLCSHQLCGRVWLLYMYVVDLALLHFSVLASLAKVFWRLPTASADSGEIILLASQCSAPGSEEGSTCTGIIRGGVGIFPGMATRVRGPKSNWNEGERENREEWLHIVENFSFPSVPFLHMVVKFLIIKHVVRMTLCYWSQFCVDFWLQIYLKLGFAECLLVLKPWTLPFPAIEKTPLPHTLFR